MPWDNLYFFYALLNLKELVSNNNRNNQGDLLKNTIITPKRMVFKAVAVCLEDLDKIRSPVGISEADINIGEFDKIILVIF
jgi:hypothetical protein